MINTQLLAKTLEFISFNPGRWNQAEFRGEDGRCCFVGLSVEVAGMKWVSDDHENEHFWYLDVEGERPVAVWTLSDRLLGLERSDYLRLISARNTFDDLQNLVSEFILKSVDEELQELREKTPATV